MSETLRDAPRPLGTATVWEVLLACPRLGPVKAKRICLEADIWPLTKLEELRPLEIELIILSLPPSHR